MNAVPHQQPRACIGSLHGLPHELKAWWLSICLMPSYVALVTRRRPGHRACATTKITQLLKRMNHRDHSRRVTDKQGMQCAPTRIPRTRPRSGNTSSRSNWCDNKGRRLELMQRRSLVYQLFEITSLCHSRTRLQRLGTSGKRRHRTWYSTRCSLNLSTPEIFDSVCLHVPSTAFGAISFPCIHYICPANPHVQAVTAADMAVRTHFRRWHSYQSQH